MYDTLTTKKGTKMARDKISKEYAVEQVQSMIDNLKYVDINDMVRDLGRLKSQLENNNQDWQETWDETIDGCDPWAIGDLERALDTLKELQYSDVDVEEIAE